jgi:hypothetical protein
VRRRGDVLYVRHVETRTDQKEVARVEMIPPCELRDRGVVVARDRRERLARPDHVDPGRRAMPVVMGLVVGDEGVVGERDRLPLDERRERVRPDDAVAAKVEALLHEAHAVQRRAVVVRVDRNADPLAHEQELEHRHVPAERAVVKCARAEERAAERPHRGSRARVREARDREALNLLEGAGRGNGPRARDRVDRPAIEALGAQRHLQSRRLRVPPAGGERGWRDGHRGGDNRCDEKEARAHGVQNYAPRAANPPA